MCMCYECVTIIYVSRLQSYSLSIMADSKRIMKKNERKMTKLCQNGKVQLKCNEKKKIKKIWKIMKLVNFEPMNFFKII